MLRRTLLLVPLMMVALLPSAGALPQGPLHCVPLSVHQYVAGTNAFAPIVRAPLGCADSADPTFGSGGAFLPADHHGRGVCIADKVASDANYYLGTDLDGDGLISPDTGDGLLGPFTGCTTNPLPVGRDGGWWVVLGPIAFTGDILTNSP